MGFGNAHAFPINHPFGKLVRKDALNHERSGAMIGGAGRGRIQAVTVPPEKGDSLP